MESHPLKILTKESLLAMVESSVGSLVFRSLYAEVNGEPVDILDNGDNACAYFVTTILHHFKLIASPHATVHGLMRDMETYGWERVEAPQVGDVLVWEAIKQVSDDLHPHCGFYMGNDEAISNDFKANPKAPARHHYTYGVRDDGSPARAITGIYRHPSLA